MKKREQVEMICIKKVVGQTNKSLDQTTEVTEWTGSTRRMTRLRQETDEKNPRCLQTMSRLMKHFLSLILTYSKVWKAQQDVATNWLISFLSSCCFFLYLDIFNQYRSAGLLAATIRISVVVIISDDSISVWLSVSLGFLFDLLLSYQLDA